MSDDGAPARSSSSGADRISALLDGVREYVMSFLPAHEAVRTTVLARSWRDLWMRSPALRITGWGRLSKFTQFIERLLRLPNGDPCAAPVPLDSCQFDLSPLDMDLDFGGEGDLSSLDNVDFEGIRAEAIETLMNDWIRWAICRQVRVLWICFLCHEELHLYLPGMTLVSEHLTSLELSGVAFCDNLDLSGCPGLQGLKMEDCVFCSDEIQAPHVKHLMMNNCSIGGFRKMDRTLICLQSHYREDRLCRELGPLPTAEYRALGKDFFPESQISGSRQRTWIQ